MLTIRAPEESERFGTSVAVSENVAVVGAYLNDGGATDAGTAYVFNATNGALTATLDNPAPAGADFFGDSVAVSGNLVVVGARNDHPGEIEGQGTAYVFDARTGALLATLDNPAPSANDQFGTSVAVSGNAVVVGAPSEDPGGVFEAGSAFMFRIAWNPNPDPQDIMLALIGQSAPSPGLDANCDDVVDAADLILRLLPPAQ